MALAYTDAAGRTSADFIELGADQIGGLTLAPGLYKWSTDVSISEDVTLSGGPNDVWIFQVAGKLKQANATRVILAGGALPKNILAGRRRGDSWNHRAVRGHRTGKNHDRREHGSIGDRQTVGSDRGHSSDECDYPARPVRTDASHVGLTPTPSGNCQRVTDFGL